jgi:lysophospholipase L1-like esterase
MIGTRMLSLAVLGLGVAVAFTGGASALVQTASPAVYLALGDSLAVGMGATVPEERGYVAHLARWMQAEARDQTNQMLNLAVNGETSETLISAGQLDAALSAIANPDTDVRVVTLDIGGNDLLELLIAGPCAVDPTGPACRAAVQARQAGFAASYEQILSTLTSALASEPRLARLVVLTYYNPFSGTASSYEVPSDAALLGSDGRIDCAANAEEPERVGLNDLIACIGLAHGAIVADLYPDFSQRSPDLTNVLARDIHANDTGHALIADVIKRAIESG